MGILEGKVGDHEAFRGGYQEGMGVAIDEKLVGEPSARAVLDEGVDAKIGR